MTAFMLACTLNGIVNGGIYFENVNICIQYRDKLNNQSYMKADKPQVYPLRRQRQMCIRDRWYIFPGCECVHTVQRQIKQSILHER